MISRRLAFGVYAELDGTLQAAGQARALVKHSLGADHPLAQDATLVISELVSNAITHSRSRWPGGTITVAFEVRARFEGLRIEVRDAGGLTTPMVAIADQRREGGRGLAIVDALAADWGSFASTTGRVTWCRLSTSERHDVERQPPDREAG